MVLARIKKQGGVCVGYEMERVVLGRRDREKSAKCLTPVNSGQVTGLCRQTRCQEPGISVPGSAKNFCNFLDISEPQFLSL